MFSKEKRVIEMMNYFFVVVLTVWKEITVMNDQADKNSYHETIVFAVIIFYNK